MANEKEVKVTLEENGFETWPTNDGHVRTNASIAQARSYGLNAKHNAWFDNGDNGKFSTIVMVDVPSEKPKRTGPTEVKDKDK